MSRIVSTETINANVSVACAHCGLPSPPPNVEGELAFCCNGCEGAFHLIRNWGLDDYYALRDQLGGSSNQAVSNSSNFSHLDDVQTLGMSAPVACGDGLVRSRLAVQGLHCGACAWLIERAASKQPGWKLARVRLSDHTLEAVFDPAQLKLSELGRLVSRLGYQVAPLIESERQQRDEAENRTHLIRIAVAGFCAANAMWIAVALYAGAFSGMAEDHRHLLHWVGVILGMISVVVPGRTFFQGALAAIRTRTPHMDLPVALGLSVGAVAGLFAAATRQGEAYFDSVAMLVFLLLVGRWVQFRQQRRATESVALLMRLTPRVAMKLSSDDGLAESAERVLADSLVRGDLIRVDAGDVFPVDGVIEKGATLVDRSLVTGESRPVEATVGDEIEAGSCNLQQPVHVRVESVGAQSRIGKITSLIEEATAERVPIVQLADRIGGWFVIAVMLAAVGTLLYWWQHGPLVAAGHAIALLIVACPCALALATPLAIAVAIGRSAKRGILIRSADALERLNHVGTVWFDKTGTLTEGRVTITDWSGPEQALALAASIESCSAHAIAVAVVQAAKRRGLEIPMATNIEQIAGCGVMGRVGSHDVHVGNQALMDLRQVRVTDEQRVHVNQIAISGSSPLLVAIDGEMVAIASLGDAVRAEAAGVIQQLKQAGWKVGVLSGDHVVTVERVADQLGMDRSAAFGAVAPEEKLAQIRASKREGQTVLMVGDGINDAAALAAADVGVAIRGGAAASLDAAPVYLASGRLDQLTDLTEACVRTVRTIRLNFAVSLGYNLFAVTLAACGWISPLVAAVLMPVSSLSVLSIVLASRTFRSSTAS